MMVKPKHQRLALGLLAVAAVIGAGLLALSGLRDDAAFFYAPGDLAGNPPVVGKSVRLGGMVEKGSIVKQPDGISIRFVVTDGKATVPVAFTGVTPDLFKEGSGVVAEGAFQPDGGFIATNILAKHDERYMPPEVAGKMHKTDSLDK